MVATQKDPARLADLLVLRRALLDFIADFANWDNATVPAYLDNIPKYGQRLADEVRKWGEWIKREAEKELAEFYPKDPDGATPIAYLWARTIQCEGPGCGAEVPLIRSLWLAKKSTRSIALQLVPRPEDKRVDFRIIRKEHDGWVDQDDSTWKIQDPELDGTVKRGSASCACCGYTTPVANVRKQLKERCGGTADARLLAIVSSRDNEPGRSFRLPTLADLMAVQKAGDELQRRMKVHTGSLSLTPSEEISLNGIRRISVPIYGMTAWGDLFSPRQLLALTTYVSLVRAAAEQRPTDAMSAAVQTILGLAISRWTDICNALCRWESTKTQVRNLFGRQAVPMVWDFAEPQIFSDAAGNYSVTLETILEFIQRHAVISTVGVAQRASAAAHTLPTDCADAFVTDPPYYDAVPYAYLSDFFYVWLRRSVGYVHPDLFKEPAVPKDAEIAVDRTHELSVTTHDVAFYESELTKAFAEGRRIAKPDAIGTVVCAGKTTASWEAILKAVVDAGWIITGSWPIDTELENRVSAQGQSRLASSVHLICRPREHPNGSVRTDDIGAWRDVPAELPLRIHDWMPRLAEEGVVGADAIFACLGPALEVFSRYARVEKASGETVTLKEYLEQVWAAVAKEALSPVFAGADTASFEPDARLTAMWLWTLNAGAPSPPTPPPGGREVKRTTMNPWSKAS